MSVCLSGSHPDVHQNHLWSSEKIQIAGHYLGFSELESPGKSLSTCIFKALQFFSLTFSMWPLFFNKLFSTWLCLNFSPDFYLK